MDKPWLKNLARAFGILCAVISLGVLAYILATGDWKAIATQFGIAAFVGATLVYTLGTFALALGWQRAFSGLPSRRLHAIYGRSSLGKYLPGNVGHFVLRQTELGRLDIPQTRIAGISLEEILSQISAALFIAGGATLLADGNGPIAALAQRWDITPWLTALAVAALLAALALPALLMWRGHFSPMRYIIRLAWAITFEGAGFLLLAQLVDTQTAFSAIGVFTLSWLGGFVAFGAPGGIGVREALITALLSGLVGASPAAALAVVLRLACVTGDALFAALTHIAKDR